MTCLDAALNRWQNLWMSDADKFSTKIDRKVLKELKSYAEVSGRTVSSIVSEAVAEYVARQHVRPDVLQAIDESLAEHEELLRRLAK